MVTAQTASILNTGSNSTTGSKSTTYTFRRKGDGYTFDLVNIDESEVITVASALVDLTGGGWGVTRQVVITEEATIFWAPEKNFTEVSEVRPPHQGGGDH
jgi:hypothetical protein